MNNSRMGRSSKCKKTEKGKKSNSKHFPKKYGRPREEKVWASSLDSSQDSLENAPDPNDFRPNYKDDEVCTRDNIQVLLRIRPKNDRERELKSRTILKALDSATIMFDPKQETVQFFFHGIRQKVYDYKQRPNKNLRFAFDHVFSPSQSNVEIFENALKSIVNHVIRGFNCSVFAYGATGSGKTYTMLGSAENPGLTFLLAKELSQRIREMANEFESEIVVSYLEVYNETIKDLLYPSGQLTIREDGLSGVNIPNLTMHKIKDTCDLLRMLSFGNNARTQHPTDHNAESSRSHAVFQVFVTLRKRITQVSLNYNLIKAKLVMVDLAGSERGSTTNSDCQRCREGGSINKSLLALGNCINALADGKKHIPYRDSKLTRLLKDALGGNCKTVMIANVAPTVINYDESYNTLRFADRAKQIRVTMKKNVIIEPIHLHQRKIVDDLRAEICQLKLLLLTERETNCTLREQNMSVPVEGGFGSNTSFLSISPAIHNPETLEKFIHLLGQKKKLEEAYVDASVSGKESEWNILWQKWKLESLAVLSPENNENRQSAYEELKNTYKNLLPEYERCQEKVQLTRRLLEFNNKEIDLIENTFLSTLKQDRPFLTVTLREFLFYKQLERQLATERSTANFNQQISNRMIYELLQREMLLSDTLEFTESLRKLLNKNGLSSKTSRFQKIVDQMYGENSTQSWDSEATFPSKETLLDMIQLIRNPIVEYDRTESVSPSRFQDQTQLTPLEVYSKTETSVNTFDPTSSSGESESSQDTQDVERSNAHHLESEFEERQVSLPLIFDEKVEDEESSELGSDYNFLPPGNKVPENYPLSGKQLLFRGGEGLKRVLSTRIMEPPLPSQRPPLSPTFKPGSQFRCGSPQKVQNPNYSSSDESSLLTQETRCRKPIPLVETKPKSDYSGSLEKDKPKLQVEPKSELLTLFKTIQNTKDTETLSQPDVKFVPRLQLSSNILQTSDNACSQTLPKPNDQMREAITCEVKRPIANNLNLRKLEACEPTDVTKSSVTKEILSHLTSSTSNSTRPLKKPVRKRRKKSTKNSLAKTLQKKVPKTMKTTAPIKSSTGKSGLKMTTSTPSTADVKTNVGSKNGLTQISLQKFIQSQENLVESQKFKRKAEGQGQSSRAADNFTSTQMFAKVSHAPTQITTTSFFKNTTPSVKLELAQPSTLPMFQKLIAQKSPAEVQPERKVEVHVVKPQEKLRAAEPKNRDVSPRLKPGNEETKSSPVCKHDSKENFWNTGMFLPSSVPESSVLSEDQLYPEKTTHLRKFTFPDDEDSIDGQQIDSDNYKSLGNSEGGQRKKSQIPRPIQIPKIVKSPDQTISLFQNKSKPRSRTKVFKLSVKNLKARERGWDDNFWKTSSDCEVSGDGDMNCGNDNTIQKPYVDHEDLIVKPPPGYAPTDDLYYTHLLTRPPLNQFI